MEKRKFGRMNKEVTILTIGGAGLGEVDQEEVDRSFKKALDVGINMIDVAPSYGDAETKLHKWVKEYRDQFFLAEKTMERTKEGAQKELENTLKTLGTDHIDLYQFHAVKSIEELHSIFGKGGAIETFLEAKEQGIIDYIGLTGHDNVQVHFKALELFDFDSLLLPVNITSMIQPDPVNDFNSVLQKAVEKHIGIIAIKAIQKRRWQGPQTYNTWYEPFDTKEEISEAITFTLSQEGVTTYSLAGETKLWDMMLEAGKNYKKIDKKTQKDLIEKYATQETQPLFPEQV